MTKNWIKTIRVSLTKQYKSSCDPVQIISQTNRQSTRLLLSFWVEIGFSFKWKRKQQKVFENVYWTNSKNYFASHLCDMCFRYGNWNRFSYLKTLLFFSSNKMIWNMTISDQKCMHQDLSSTEESLVVLLSISHKRHGKCHFNLLKVAAISVVVRSSPKCGS